MEDYFLNTARMFNCKGKICLSSGGLLYILRNFVYYPSELTTTKIRYRLKQSDIDKLMKWTEQLKKHIQGLSAETKQPEDINRFEVL